ncbi:hypothetical protein LSPH24S_04112 [Lysinibacillus sphaericus]
MYTCRCFLCFNLYDWQRLFITLEELLECGKRIFGAPVRKLFNENEEPSFNWQQFMSSLQASDILQDLNGIQLFFEPGRFLVADYGFYATEILDIKQSHQQYFAVVRGGTHHNRLPASWGHNQPFQLYASETWTYPFQRPSLHNKKARSSSGIMHAKGSIAYRCFYVFRSCR